jgi:hypothetical protein
MKTQSIIKGLFAIIFTVFMFFNGKSQFNYTIKNNNNCDMEVSVTIYDSATNTCLYLPAFSIASGVTETIPTTGCSVIYNIEVLVTSLGVSSNGCSGTLTDFFGNGFWGIGNACFPSSISYTSLGTSSGVFIVN